MAGAVRVWIDRAVVVVVVVVDISRLGRTCFAGPRRRIEARSVRSGCMEGIGQRKSYRCGQDVGYFVVDSGAT